MGYKEARTAPVYLTRRKRTVAVLVEADEFGRLCELAEDAEDAAAAASSRREMEETGELPVPWEEVKAELGIAEKTTNGNCSSLTELNLQVGDSGSGTYA